MNIWIAGKNSMKTHYHLKKLITDKDYSMPKKYGMYLK